MAPATRRYQRGESYKPTVEKGKKQQLIEQVFADHKRRYGSRRIVAELKPGRRSGARPSGGSASGADTYETGWFTAYSAAPAARLSLLCPARRIALMGKVTGLIYC